MTFQSLYVFFFIRHERRELLHVNVTAGPTAAWIWRQLLEATPWGRQPTHWRGVGPKPADMGACRKRKGCARSASQAWRTSWCAVRSTTRVETTRGSTSEESQTFRPTVYGRTLRAFLPFLLFCVVLLIARRDLLALAAVIVVGVPVALYYVLTQLVSRVTVTATTITVRNLFGDSSDYTRSSVAKLVKTHWMGGKGGPLPYIAARGNDGHTVFRLTGSYDPEAIAAALSVPVTGSWSD